jgi:hypothetical protein
MNRVGLETELAQRQTDLDMLGSFGTYAVLAVLRVNFSSFYC